jgi:hypothetical protein
LLFTFGSFFIFVYFAARHCTTTEAARVFAQSCVELVKTLSDIAYRVHTRFLPEGWP